MTSRDYETYVGFGTLVDERGNSINAGRRRDLPHLTEAEAALYECLTNPTWRRHRRIEQEWIPLKVARDIVLERLRHLSITNHVE